MKTLLAALVAFLLAAPAFAGGPKTPYWTCMQIGHLNKSPVLVVSDIQTSPFKSLEERQKAFAKAVKKQWELTGEFEPHCQDFASKRDAKKLYDHIVKKANKNGLTVLPMEFKYGGQNVQQEK